MEQQAATLLTTLKRTAASSETKLNLLNALKSDIKHYRVPESAQATIFDALRLAISQSASSTIANSAFSTVGHLIKRLKIQDASGHTIAQLAPRLLPALQDRLGDPREPLRTSTSHALTELWPYIGNEIERIVRDEAIAGPNARAKEAGMQWLVRMHKEENLPFKSYVSPIVSCLESNDGNVREAAKVTLVELFTDAPNGAKADLKKQLKAHSVRHSIETQLLEQIGGVGAGGASRPPTARAPGAEQEMDMGASTRSLPPAFDHVAHFKETILSDEAKPPPSQETVPMDPIYVHSQRECDDAFSDMLPFFEGKETEGNWMNRDKSVLKLRRMTKGNAPNEYHRSFMAGIKSTVEGILKVANSLRTTMSTNGCQCVQELAKTLGPALDPHVEMFLQSFIKMSASTKHIASENGTNTSDSIFQNVTYNNRLIQHVWSAAQDKNALVRQSATVWLRSILRRQANYSSHFQSSGGLELAEKCIKKGIDDANPKVKEGARASYWLFARGWSDRAEMIMNGLDQKSKGLLEKDPNNPNKSAASSQSSTSTAHASSRPAPAGRSALKEMMAAQKKAKMQGRLPERPGSAMAALSPSKPKASSTLGSSHNRAPSNLSQSSRGEARVPSAASTTSTAGGSSNSGNTAKAGSLMSGPLRRPRKPEIRRPQTADPYASQRLLRPETPANRSPGVSPPKGTGGSKSSIPMSARSRAHTSETSPTLGNTAKKSPFSDQRPTSNGSGSDPTSTQVDDFTMVLPHRGNITTVRGHDHRPPMTQTMSVDSGLPSTAEEDNFTMVMPDLNNNPPRPHSRAASPSVSRKPMKQLIEEARLRASDANTRPGSSRARDPSHSPALEMPPPRPARRGSRSPVKSLTPQPQEVQIYEDPFTAEHASPNPAGHDDANRAVLSELPVNENVRVQSPTQSISSSQHSAHSSPQHPSPQHRNRSPQPRSPHPTANTTNGDTISTATTPTISTPQDRAEVLRNRRLLESGISRLRSRNLDAHGFRRVQELAKIQDSGAAAGEMWDQGRLFEELMTALLEYLYSSFSSETSSARLGEAKGLGLRAQALGLLRGLCVVQKKSAASGGWYAKSLAMLVSCRGWVEGNSGASAQAVDEVQRTVDAILSATAANGAVQDGYRIALFEWLDSPSQDAPAADLACALALSTLRSLLPRDVDVLGKEQLNCAIATAAQYLKSPSPDVRKASTDLAAELYALVVAQGGEEDGGAQDEGVVVGAGENGGAKKAFWEGFKGVEEGRMALLTYYIARRGMA